MKLHPGDLSDKATVDVLSKKVFTKIFQISQKNTCVESVFNKVAVLRACNFI